MLRSSSLLLALRFGARIAAFGFLALLPVVLTGLGAPNSFWTVLPAAPGVIGIVFTLYTFSTYPFRLRRCRKVLAEYPLEPAAYARHSKSANSIHGTLSTLHVKRRKGAERREMVASEVQDRGSWPEGAKEGVWIAGDLPFGGVATIPTRNALLLMRPADWDATAAERRQADGARLARAERAGLERKRGLL
ncbi:hypothetical protein HCC30_05140 [Streptomyces sp. HNM0574]|nr:hypothetical protein [Streptomyces sp. HNM0574]